MIDIDDNITKAANNRSAYNFRLSPVWWERFGAIALVLLGIAAFVVTSIIIVRSYSPYLFWDQWSQIAFLIELIKHPTVTAFWSQHNEHRIPIQRLLCLADLKLFGGTNKSLLFETFIIQCAHAGLIAWVAKKYGALRTPVFLSLLGFVVYCLFSPLQIEVFYWGFEVTFVLVGLAASACFACAVSYPGPDTYAGKFRQNGLVIAAIMSCFVAEVSLANGLFTWFLLLALALKLKFERQHVAAIFLAASIAILAYFVNYHSPPENSNPLQTIRQPGHVLSYVVACLSFSWDDSPVRALGWPRLSQSVALIAVLFSVGGAIRCFANRSASRLQLFVFSNLLFALATLVVNALGRLRFGYEHAQTSRYQSTALLFWACIGVLVALYASRYSTRAIQWVQVAAIVLLLSSIYRWDEMQRSALQHQAAVKAGWIALSSHLRNDPALLQLFPDPSPLPQWFDFLQQRHLGAEPVTSGPAIVEDVPNRMRLSGFTYRPTGCDGRVDRVMQTTRQAFWLAGWAYDFQDGTSNVAVVVASPQGHILGSTPLSTMRPDVPKVLPNIRATNTGWSLTLNLPFKGDYSVFLVRNRDHSACPIQGIIHVQDVPRH